MSPAEIVALAAFIVDTAERLVEGTFAHDEAFDVRQSESAEELAAQLAEKYVIFERTEPKRAYCDECGFSGGPAGHHPRCTEYSRIQRAAGDKHGFGRTT